MKKRTENTNLKAAIVVTLFSAIVFLFLFIFLAISHRSDVYNNSKRMAMEISRNAAYETQVYLFSTIEKVRWLEEKVILLHRLNAPRSEIDTLLKETILDNQNYLGAWTMWEPNAFDGKDYLYKNDTLYNELGTVGVAFFRENGSICRETMVEGDYKGDYYALPKEMMGELLVEPYKFKYSGYDSVYLGSTVSVPIISDSVFLGVIGLDIDLGSLQEKLNKIRPYETGYLSLISNSGTILTHNDTSLILKNIRSFIDKSDSLSFPAIFSGIEFEIETVSEFTGEDVFRLFYPIVVSKNSKPWSMMIEIPVAQAASLSKQVMLIAIVTLILGMALLIYLFINITERRRYEKVIFKAKAQAEESDRLKTAFLNNISHEIRTPLNGILGFTGMLFDKNTSEEDAKDYKKFIESSSQQLLSTMSSVIELSKIQSQQIQISVVDFEIEETILELAANFKKKVESKNLKLDLNLLGEKSIINTDKNKFIQVYSHLINNAIKFTEEGVIEIGYEAIGDSYAFYVKDTGIGINPNKLKYIFSSFRQEEFSLSRKYGGLGIGLSISKSFIHKLKGSIKVESELQKGSVFTFSLPKNL